MIPVSDRRISESEQPALLPPDWDRIAGTQVWLRGGAMLATCLALLWIASNWPPLALVAWVVSALFLMRAVLFLVQVISSGVLLVSHPRTAAYAPASSHDNALTDAFVLRAARLIDDGFRRERDWLDGHGWLGFRLFLAGMARAMGREASQMIQKEYCARLLAHIGDRPSVAARFTGAWAEMDRNPANRRMIDCGARAWDLSDPNQFPVAIAWWTGRANRAVTSVAADLGQSQAENR